MRSELPVVYHPAYDVLMPEGHVFPMSKFRGVRELLQRDALAVPVTFHRPEPVSRDQVELVHDPGYVRDYLEGTLDEAAMRRIGFPWNEAVVRRTMHAAGGTLLTARLALQHGIAANTAGGTHHAFRDHGSGFCIFNDLAITCRVLLDERRVRRVLIVDLDVHQGDGTAMIFADEPRVVTFSMHGERNFPRIKRDSDVDVALPDDTTDGAYLEALQSHLPRLLRETEPDLVLYDAGVDPHAVDRFGKLALSNDGLQERDRFVIESCRASGVPVACVIGGGYDRDLEALVRRHTIVHRVAAEVLAAIPPATSPAASPATSPAAPTGVRRSGGIRSRVNLNPSDESV